MQMKKMFISLVLLTKTIWEISNDQAKDFPNQTNEIGERQAKHLITSFLSSYGRNLVLNFIRNVSVNTSATTEMFESKLPAIPMNGNLHDAKKNSYVIWLHYYTQILKRFEVEARRDTRNVIDFISMGRKEILVEIYRQSSNINKESQVFMSDDDKGERWILNDVEIESEHIKFEDYDIREIIGHLQQLLADNEDISIEQSITEQQVYPFKWPETLEEHNLRRSRLKARKDTSELTLSDKLIAQLVDQTDFFIDMLNISIASIPDKYDDYEVKQPEALLSDKAKKENKKIKAIKPKDAKRNLQATKKEESAKGISHVLVPKELVPFLTQNEEAILRRLVFFEFGIGLLNNNIDAAETGRENAFNAYNVYQMQLAVVKFHAEARSLQARVDGFLKKRVEEGFLSKHTYKSFDQFLNELITRQHKLSTSKRL